MKIWKAAIASSALILLLSACGTSDDTDSATPEETEEVTSGEQDQSEDTTEEETEAGEDTGEAAEEEPEAVEPIGERVESDNQPFSLELLDGYSLTAEEPNRDVVYFDENDAAFMRIETISKEEGDRTQLVDTLKQTIQASDNAGSLMEISSPTKLPNVDMPVGYEMDVEGGQVSGYVFETELHYVRATIYDVSDVMKTGEFIQMLSTLQTN